jgi:hypothetical protein
LREIYEDHQFPRESYSRGYRWTPKGPSLVLDLVNLSDLLDELEDDAEDEDGASTTRSQQPVSAPKAVVPPASLLALPGTSEASRKRAMSSLEGFSTPSKSGGLLGSVPSLVGGAAGAMPFNYQHATPGHSSADLAASMVEQRVDARLKVMEKQMDTKLRLILQNLERLKPK